MNFFEACSYSWNVNSNESVARRAWRVAGDTAASVFSSRPVDLEAVNSLIVTNPECKKSYFYRSLRERDALKLETPEGYEKHKRILIDGRQVVGKNSFINALRGKKFDDISAAPMSGVPKNITSTQFYNFNNDIALCRVPSYTGLEEEVRDYNRYNDYDSVVFMLGAPILTEYDIEMMQIAKNSDKPYLVVMSCLDKCINHYSFDHDGNSISVDEITEIVMAEIFNKLTKALQSIDLMPSNGKPLIINNRDISAFDFPEVFELIKSEDFRRVSSDSLTA
ncbi:MAG: 50S ribosome-binding GTPase [Endozoicomonadaceae bacterium]|nr:50S ribosome-binding GTPase [Endozoicomonadaceae bacterium]